MPTLEEIKDIHGQLSEVQKELIVAAGEHEGLLRERPPSDAGRGIYPVPEHEFGDDSRRLRAAFVEGMDELLRWRVFEQNRAAYRLTGLGWAVEETL